MFVSLQLTVNNNNLLAIIVVSLLLVGSIGSVFASSESPYQSGYSHGEDDCGEDFEDRYINQPGKGPSHHTRAFMNGYNDAIANCGGGSSGGGDRGIGSLEDDIRGFCTNELGWSEERCDTIIDAGKTYLICTAARGMGIPLPC
jgi:hypothetical protein